MSVMVALEGFLWALSSVCVVLLGSNNEVGQAILTDDSINLLLSLRLDCGMKQHLRDEDVGRTPSLFRLFFSDTPRNDGVTHSL